MLLTPIAAPTVPMRQGRPMLSIIRTATLTPVFALKSARICSIGAVDPSVGENESKIVDYYQNAEAMAQHFISPRDGRLILLA